jgi:hypothetical protein
MTEYIYYAKPKGAPDYMEEIVLKLDRGLTMEERGRLDTALTENGMEFTRVWEWKGEAPDFAGAVRI